MLSQIEADIFVHLSQIDGYNEQIKKEKRPSHIDFVRRSQPLSLLRRQLPYRGEPLAKRAGFTKCQGLSSIGATTTTAASGGNRESLLGPRPARRKQSAAAAGCRNPGSGSAPALTERLFQPLRLVHPQHQIHALDGCAGRAFAQIVEQGHQHHLVARCVDGHV